MTDHQVEKLINAQPFSPFRIELRSGENIVVNSPRKALVSGGVLAVEGLVRRESRAPGRVRVRMMYLRDVASIQPVAAG
jgi:hypothetical protein